MGEGKRALASLKKLSNSEILRIDNPDDLTKTKIILKESSGEKTIELKNYPPSIQSAALVLFQQKKLLQDQVNALKEQVDLSGTSYKNLTQSQLQSIALRKNSIEKLKKENDNALKIFKETFEEVIKSLNSQDNASSIEIQLNGLNIKKKDGSKYEGKKSLAEIQSDLQKGTISNKDMLAILGSEKERLNQLSTDFKNLTKNQEDLIKEVNSFLVKIKDDLLGFTTTLTETNQNLNSHNNTMKTQHDQVKQDLANAEKELKDLGMNSTDIDSIKHTALLPSSN